MSTRARLSLLCAHLYDARTPRRTRVRLSFEVSVLRAQLAGGKDMLDAMTAAGDEEEAGS